MSAARQYGVVLGPQSLSAAERLSEVEENDPSHLTPKGLQYRKHRLAVVHILFDEFLRLDSPFSERLEIRRLQNILQVGDGLAHQRLKAYMSGSAVWLAPPDLRGVAYFVFKA